MQSAMESGFTAASGAATAFCRLLLSNDGSNICLNKNTHIFSSQRPVPKFNGIKVELKSIYCKETCKIIKKSIAEVFQ